VEVLADETATVLYFNTEQPVAGLVSIHSKDGDAGELRAGVDADLDAGDHGLFNEVLQSDNERRVVDNDRPATLEQCPRPSGVTGHQR
jgi:hypothetical protein